MVSTALPHLSNRKRWFSQTRGRVWFIPHRFDTTRLKGRTISNSYQLINLSIIHRWCLRPRPPGWMWLLTWSSAWPCHRGDDTLLAPDSLSRSHWNKKYGLIEEQMRMKEACLWNGKIMWTSKAMASLSYRVLCYLSLLPYLTRHFKGSSKGLFDCL